MWNKWGFVGKLFFGDGFSSPFEFQNSEFRHRLGSGHPLTLSYEATSGRLRNVCSGVGDQQIGHWSALTPFVATANCYGRHRGLAPRHARLAAGAAVAFVNFVSETYHQRIVPQAQRIAGE